MTFSQKLRTLCSVIFFLLTPPQVLPKIQDCSDNALKLKFFKGICSYPNGTESQSKFTQNPKWNHITQQRQDLRQIGINFDNDKAKFAKALFNQTWFDILKVQLNQTAQSQARFKEFKGNYTNVTLAPDQVPTKLNTTLPNLGNDTIISSNITWPKMKKGTPLWPTAPSLELKEWLFLPLPLWSVF